MPLFFREKRLTFREKRLTFREKRLIEQTRYMEEAGVLTPEADPPPVADSASLEERLLDRARRTMRQVDLDPDHAARLSRRFALALVLIAAFAGGAAVLQAVTVASDTLNIYWLLLVLLGVNFISMLLWLIGMATLRSTGTAHGALKTVWHWLEPRITHRNPLQAAADKGWLLAHHHGPRGRWWLAELSQGLWMSYLLAGITVLLLLLMTRQFDFVWATTILSRETFVNLTQWLSAPLQTLGISVPDVWQIELSRQGVTHAAQAESRRAWAAFLLGSLALYGVLPRLGLWLFSRFMKGLSWRRFQLDLTLPYYVRLRHQLMPATAAWKIIDPDRQPLAAGRDRKATGKTASLPLEALWVGVEVTAGGWPPKGVDRYNDLGQVTGAETLSGVLAKLATARGRKPLVIAVSLHRSPDRGIKRTLLQLYARSTSTDKWLVVIGSDATPRPPGFEQRLSEWQAIAEACAIPGDHLTIIGDDAG